MPWLDYAGAACSEPEPDPQRGLNGCLEGACAIAVEEMVLWKPLVLLIPLRLGLSDINEAYMETLKVGLLPSRTVTGVSCVIFCLPTDASHVHSLQGQAINKLEERGTWIHTH